MKFGFWVLMLNVESVLITNVMTSLSDMIYCIMYNKIIGLSSSITGPEETSFTALLLHEQFTIIIPFSY